MINIFLPILTPQLLKSIKKCQGYGHFNICGSSFKDDTLAYYYLTAISTTNTALVFMTANFKSAVGCVTAFAPAFALNLYSMFSKMFL